LGVHVLSSYVLVPLCQLVPVGVRFIGRWRRR
jgi:hypothetical protein